MQPVRVPDRELDGGWSAGREADHDGPRHVDVVGTAA